MALLMGGVTGGRSTFEGDLDFHRGRLRRGEPFDRSWNEGIERAFSFCMFSSILSLYPVSGKFKRE
jgi:hypothetical protein